MNTKAKKLLSLVLSMMMILSFAGITASAETETTLTKIIYASAELGTDNSGSIQYAHDYNSKIRYYKFNVDGVNESLNFSSDAKFNVTLHESESHAGQPKENFAIYDIPASDWSMADSFDALTENVGPAIYATDEYKIAAAGNTGEVTVAKETVGIDIKSWLRSFSGDVASFMLCCHDGNEDYRTIWSMSLHTPNGLSWSGYIIPPHIKITYNLSTILAAVKADPAGVLEKVAFPLDLNIEKYNMLDEAGKKVIQNALSGKNFSTALEVKQAYDAAFSKLSYTDTANKILVAKSGYVQSEGGISNSLPFNLEPNFNSAQVWATDISSLKNRAFAVSKVEFYAVRHDEGEGSVGSTDVIFSDLPVSSLEELNTITTDTFKNYVDFSKKAVDYSYYMLGGAQNGTICADVTDFVKDDLLNEKNITVFCTNRGASTDTQGSSPYWIRTQEQNPNDTYLTVTYDKMTVISKIKDMTSTAEIESYLTSWADILEISDKSDDFSEIAICLYKNESITSIDEFYDVAENAEAKAPEIALSKVNEAQTEADMTDVIAVYGAIMGVDTVEFSNLSDSSKLVAVQAVLDSKGDGYETISAVTDVLSKAIETVSGDVMISVIENIIYTEGAFAINANNSWHAEDMYLKFPLNETGIKADKKYILSAKATFNFVNHSHDDGIWNVKYYTVPSEWSESKLNYTSDEQSALKSGEIIGEAVQTFYEATSSTAMVGEPQVTGDITDFVKENVNKNEISLRVSITRSNPSGQTFRRVYTRYDMRLAPYLTITYDMNALLSDLNKSSEDNLEAFIMTNGGVLGFNIDTYAKIADKDNVNKAVFNKNFTSSEAAAKAFNNALKTVVATKQISCEFSANNYGHVDVYAYQTSDSFNEIKVTIPTDYDKTYVTDVQFFEKRAGTGNDGPVNVIFTNLTGENPEYIAQLYSKGVDVDEVFDITDEFNSATPGSTLTFGVQKASSDANLSLSGNTVCIKINYDFVKIMNAAAKEEDPTVLLTKYADIIGIEDVSKVAELLKGKTITDAYYAKNLIKTAESGMKLYAEITDVSVSVTNMTSVDTAVTVIVAAYNENGSLAEVVYAQNEDGKILANACEELTYSLSVKDPYKVKAFVWYSEDTLSPAALSTEK